MGNEHIIDRLADGGLVFLMGMLVVFGGICIIVLSIYLVGKVIDKLDLDGTKKAAAVAETVTNDVVADAAVDADGIPAEIKVAIIAAISAYYDNAAEKCDFVVRKIRRF